MRNLQEALRSRGFNPGPADGVSGPKTKAAVQAFQRAQGLKVDGIAGRQTYAKLGIEAPKATGSASVTLTPAELRQYTNQPGALGKFLSAALAQQGDTYVYGAKAGKNNPDPTALDCSGLVSWAAQQAGLKMDGSSMMQLKGIIKAGTKMSVEDALRTPGALLFREGSEPHVAISLGDGRTMEARGTKDGVGVFEGAAGRHWTAGGRIPGM